MFPPLALEELLVLLLIDALTSRLILLRPLAPSGLDICERFFTAPWRRPFPTGAFVAIFPLHLSGRIIESGTRPPSSKSNLMRDEVRAGSATPNGRQFGAGLRFLRSSWMRTEILPADEMPAMTAEHMRRAIHAAYEAYENDDRDALEQVIAEDFSFTSPYDNAIDREEYFHRCWPNHKTTASMMLERVVIDGDGAYITYVGTNTSGRSFRNTEYMTFRNGKIASVEVFFGPEYRDGAMLPAEIRHPNRPN